MYCIVIFQVTETLFIKLVKCEVIINYSYHSEGNLLIIYNYTHFTVQLAMATI